MVRIDDGGKNGSVTVSNNQRLDVSSRSASREYYESRDAESVYTVLSVDATAVANEETIYLQNTSTDKDIIIEALVIATDTASQWRVKFVTGTAAGGSALTPVNLNKASSKSAIAVARGDGSVTGLTDAGDLALIRVKADDTHHHDFHEAVRLGQDDAIAVECETNAAVEISITFHFDSE